MYKKVTIKDVAAAAGVSHQTVSRVMNDRPDVALATRLRVQEVIERLNYQPSAIARSLSRQRSYTLGAVTAGLKYLGPSRTLSGITEQAEESGYAVLLKELPSLHTIDITHILNFLISRHVDGIIWAVAEIGENRAFAQQQFSELSIPVIFLTMEPRENLFIVTVDNFLGGKMATGHLLEQGYSHIGHITGPLDWWESRQRKAGWEAALQAAGLLTQDGFWQSGDWSSASGALAMSKLLDSYPQMDALFVGNDQMALGVLQHTCRLGIKVPDELALVGFDNINESGYFWPPLTTVFQDQRLLGRTAVSELIRIIEAVHQGEEEIEPKAITLLPELIVRESSPRKVDA